MTEPKRIQLRRTAGWRKPEGAIVVARPTKWGNPWRIVPHRNNDFPRGEAALVVHVDGDRRAGPYPLHTPTPGVRGKPWTDGIGAPYWAVQYYRWHLEDHPGLIALARTELVGRDLACWCRLDQPCHADVLLEICREA